MPCNRTRVAHTNYDPRTVEAMARDKTGRMLVKMCVILSVLIALMSSAGGVLYYLRYVNAHELKLIYALISIEGRGIPSRCVLCV